jgi:hypothetical protein
MYKVLCRLLIFGGIVLGGITVAYGDALLAPYYDTRQSGGTSAATVVSVITKDFQSPQVGPYNIQWTYWFKSSLTNLDEACSRNSQTVSAAQKSNDITTFNLADGTTFFEPSNPLNQGRMAPTGPTVGMFAVWNGKFGDENSMAGEVIFLSASAQGTLLSTYRMANDPNETGADNFDDIGYGAFGSSVSVAPLLTWFPSGVFSSNWIVSVVDANMDNLAATNLWVELALSRQRPGTNGQVANYDTGFYYDRDGNAISTSQTVTLRCIGLLTLADLIDVGGLASAQNIGGWAHLGIVDLDAGTTAIEQPGSIDRGILVGKIETLDPFSLYTSQNRQDY